MGSAWQKAEVMTQKLSVLLKYELVQHTERHWHGYHALRYHTYVGLDRRMDVA